MKVAGRHISRTGQIDLLNTHPRQRLYIIQQKWIRKNQA